MITWKKERHYEGSPASSIIAMAVMERSGIRALIDSSVEYDDSRKLSPGMAVKAMIAPIFDARKKMPLTGIGPFHSAAPFDLLFGKNVTKESLNDNALARNLDDLFDTGLEELFWKCSSMIKRKFGFDSKVRHMDATNYSIHAVQPDDPWIGPAVPAYCMNAKNGRNDLLQYNAATITDGDRILEYCKAYSGNAADPVMNRDTLEFLKGCIDPEENTVIADCKLVNTELITELNTMNMGFISKLPASFSKKVRDKIVTDVAKKTMNDSSIAGYKTYDTSEETLCGKLRFIAYRSPKSTVKAMNYLKRQGERDSEKRFKLFAKKEFACEIDAIAMFSDVMKEHKNSAYVITGTPMRYEETVRREKRGRPSKDSEVPETKVMWKIVTSMRFDEDLAKELADIHNISVIVTNLPSATSDRENIRHGATTDTVLRLYLDQYKAEHTYRLMKSGMGVDSVYVRTPTRANALLFVVAIATLISSVMDAMLKRNGKGRHKTVRQICIEIQNAILEYHRSDNAMSVLGPPGSADAVFEYLDKIDLDSSYLLEIYDG